MATNATYVPDQVITSVNITAVDLSKIVEDVDGADDGQNIIAATSGVDVLGLPLPSVALGNHVTVVNLRVAFQQNADTGTALVELVSPNGTTLASLFAEFLGEFGDRVVIGSGEVAVDLPLGLFHASTIRLTTTVNPSFHVTISAINLDVFQQARPVMNVTDRRFPGIHPARHEHWYMDDVTGEGPVPASARPGHSTSASA